MALLIGLLVALVCLDILVRLLTLFVNKKQGQKNDQEDDKQMSMNMLKARIMFYIGMDIRAALLQIDDLPKIHKVEIARMPKPDILDDIELARSYLTDMLFTFKKYHRIPFKAPERWIHEVYDRPSKAVIAQLLWASRYGLIDSLV